MRPTRNILLTALALALLAGAPAAAAGEPVGIAESFPTRCNVDSVAIAPGGGAWFACREYVLRPDGLFFARAKAGRVSAAGKVTEFSGPFRNQTEPGLTATAVDGSFWFAVETAYEIGNEKPAPPSLAQVTPTGQVRLFPIGVSGRFAITELVALPDGSLLFKTGEGFEHKNPAVWQVTPTGQIAKTAADPSLPLDPAPAFPQKPVAPPGALLGGSVIGADGNLWYGVQSGSDKSAIGRITPTGETTEFSRCLAYGEAYFGPEALVRGAEGNIWFTSLAERSLPNIVDPPSIGVITPAGAITQIYAGVKVEPKTIAADPEGGAWFAGGLEDVQRIKPPQGPVNTVHIGKLSAVRRNGSALLTVKVPSAGRLQAKPVAVVVGSHPKKAKRTAIHAPTSTAAAAACGSPQIRVKLAGKALGRLRSDGKVQVSVAVTFTPAGGHPYTEEKNLRFRAPAA